MRRLCTALDLDELDDTKIDEVRKVFSENGLKGGTICCSINHLDGDPVKRKRNNEYTVKALQKCRRFGAEMVTTNAWGDRNKTMEENIEVYAEVFGEYARIAESEGARIAIENCPHWIGVRLPSWNMAFSPEIWRIMLRPSRI
jgi:sugar phosphate isomerase/epimerase